ncbi:MULTISPECIES: hypothetical protein [unclassified Streptomyces]|uniref:hypothetical protein n=1 Tax=unclassified Streptomyces TaxID=2593676 RepID=UPI000CD584D1|nr:hypothetical protein [Streptomyces sp. SM10]
MLNRTGLRAAIPAVILGALLVGCSAATTTDGPGSDVPYVDPASAQAARAEAEKTATPSPAATPVIEVGPDPTKKVRDAFAGLQATYQDGCAPGGANCAYFLGRVNEELGGLDKAMKADRKGPGHFKEPIAWIATLRTALDGDLTTPNLEKHRSELIGTRDRVNAWMQDYPEDYR